MASATTPARGDDVDHQIPVPRPQLRRLADELATALRAVTEARAASDALEVLTQVTEAIEDPTATQHERVTTCCWPTATPGARSERPSTPAQPPPSAATPAANAAQLRPHQADAPAGRRAGHRLPRFL